MPMTDEEYANRSRDVVIRFRQLRVDINEAFISGQIDVKQYKGLLDNLVRLS